MPWFRPGQSGIRWRKSIRLMRGLTARSSTWYAHGREWRWRRWRRGKRMSRRFTGCGRRIWKKNGRMQCSRRKRRRSGGKRKHRSTSRSPICIMTGWGDARFILCRRSVFWCFCLWRSVFRGSLRRSIPAGRISWSWPTPKGKAPHTMQKFWRVSVLRLWGRWWWRRLRSFWHWACMEQEALKLFFSLPM